MGVFEDGSDEEWRRVQREETRVRNRDENTLGFVCHAKKLDYSVELCKGGKPGKETIRYGKIILTVLDNSSEQDQWQRDLCNGDGENDENVRPIKEVKIWFGDR